MDIATLEANLENYNTQLQQVEQALISNSCTELTTLRDDIKELIGLTEESLLSFKKTKLLSSLDKEDEVQEVEDDGSEELSSFIGMQCRVPYTTPWGTTQDQNAVIMSVELPDNQSEGFAKVLFLTPTTRHMMSCEQFMKGTCGYNKCKYSHGYEVPVSNISDYEAPDFEEFRKGKRSLCKKEDGLWAPGTVTAITNEAVYVKLDGSSVESMLSYEDIVPLAEEGGEESDDDDVDSKIAMLQQLPIKAKQSIGFGGWEEHTECFGSKMLHKWGYVPGRGLGPRQDGILNPVEADIIPPGVSLDTIAELRGKCLIRTVYKLNMILKKKAEQKFQSHENKVDKSGSVFSIMNNLLETKKRKQVEEKPKNKQPMKAASEKSVRMTSVSIQNDVKHSKKRLADLSRSLNRNKGQAEYCEKVMAKINEEKKVLAALERKQAKTDSELKKRSNSSKLKIF